MSPEYAMGGIFSEKSDVFSFGVLTLEIVSGRKNTSFHYYDQQLSLIAHVSSISFSLIFYKIRTWMCLKLNVICIGSGLAPVE